MLQTLQLWGWSTPCPGSRGCLESDLIWSESQFFLKQWHLKSVICIHSSVLFEDPRQGCPLFPCILKPLAVAIRKNASLTGMTVGNGLYKMSLHASTLENYWWYRKSRQLTGASRYVWTPCQQKELFKEQSCCCLLFQVNAKRKSALG